MKNFVMALFSLIGQALIILRYFCVFSKETFHERHALDMPSVEQKSRVDLEAAAHPPPQKTDFWLHIY